MEKILIVDDTAVLAQSIAESLSMEGYEVLICDDPLNAIHAILEFKPDLVLSDLVMPEIDGLELVRRLRASKSFNTTPILILTADANPDNAIKARRAGANLLLHKPFDYDEFINHIKKLINTK